MSVFTNPASSAADQSEAYVAAVLGLLGDSDPIEVLRQTPSALGRVLELPASLLSQPEAPGKWSINEVLQHLADSELVGGYRFRMVLAHERPELQGYDQDLWADRLRYRDADPQEAVVRFTTLRGANVRLLEHLPAQDLRRVGQHRERGEESLDRLIRLYAGHDLLHLRQLDRIRRNVAREA
jgi:DinB superfamily